MAEKQRYQNPVVGDDLVLSLFAYNSNNRANFDSIASVDIYFLDPNDVSESNPDGRRLVQTIDGSDVTNEETGLYKVTISLTDPTYVIGKYIDIWNVVFETNNNPTAEIPNSFEIYPDLWYTTTIPIVYDFNFRFSPNKIRKGSKRWLIIDITPNVPKATDLQRYYTNLAIAAPIKVSIEQACVPCMPAEESLRLVVDEEDVEVREKCVGYWFLNTDSLELNSGIYNIWFTMEFGENKYISDKQQIQIYE